MGFSFRLISSYFLFYIHFLGFFPTILGFTNETDKQALVAIKNLVNEDPFHALTSWNDSLHFCSWHGVTCNLRHQRVTLLNLSSLQLAGTLSPHIANLTFLSEVNLQDNKFRAKIPEEIGRLFHLQYLRLSNNSFQGNLPINLTNCFDLQILDLRGNNFTGNIPAELSSLYKLYALSFSRNNFTGNIPPSLGNLSSLRILSLSRNNLHGAVPVNLGQLFNLQVFEMSSNKLSGNFPFQIYNISSLQTFSITNNLLTGTFPPNLGLTLPNLKLFLADLNGFSGSIPPSLANASGLVKISIGDNKLTGPIPLNLGSLKELQVLHFGGDPLGTDNSNDISFLSSLTNCTSLIILSLSRIQIRGVLPNSIGNFSTTLNRVWLDQNYISGTIPVEIGNLVGLSYLTIDTNLLTGQIPDSIGKLTNLQELDLFTNNITGKVPFSIGNITGLSMLDLHENALEGSIPVSLGNCSDLQVLHLRKNQISGSIPREVIGLSTLIGLILDQNYLTGSLPSQVDNLQHLSFLGVSENKISGEIPSSIGNCLMLEELYMEGNVLQGAIPSSLGQLKSIQVIDFSRNNLSGLIPKTLGQLRLLRNLNLSFNMLEGELPNEGVFTNISKFSIQSNQNLCGGINSLRLPACPNDVKKKRRKFSARTVYILSISIPFSVILILFGVYAIFRGRNFRKNQPSSASTKERHHPKISYAELSQSTNEFSLENLIGEGRYGSVYKGFLNSSQQIVAVKVLKLQEHGAEKSFIAECEALRNIRHRNLVRIITSCSSIDTKGNDFKALVFEIMPNGSLDMWLHQNFPEQNLNLNLTQRVNIAIDVASALDYLHHDCGTPIVHCDLKPNNVLLDSDFCARLTDFGLAKFLLARKGTSRDAQSSSIGIRGTIGYVPPEYGMGGEISTQGDVYSYGILLLEMFTGKRPTDSTSTESFSLYNYVKTSLPHGVMDIVDPKMLPEEESSNSSRTGKSSNVEIEECLESIFIIGVSCAAGMPKERMSIEDVLMVLHPIRNKLLQVRRESRGREKEK